MQKRRKGEGIHVRGRVPVRVVVRVFLYIFFLTISGQYFIFYEYLTTLIFLYNIIFIYEVNITKYYIICRYCINNLTRYIYELLYYIICIRTSSYRVTHHYYTYVCSIFENNIFFTSL